MGSRSLAPGTGVGSCSGTGTGSCSRTDSGTGTGTGSCFGACSGAGTGTGSCFGACCGAGTGTGSCFGTGSCGIGAGSFRLTPDSGTSVGSCPGTGCWRDNSARGSFPDNGTSVGSSSFGIGVCETGPGPGVAALDNSSTGALVEVCSSDTMIGEVLLLSWCTVVPALQRCLGELRALTIITSLSCDLATCLFW